MPRRDRSPTTTARRRAQGRNDAGENEGENGSAPRVVRGAWLELTERAVAKNQNHAQDQAGQTAQERADQRVNMNDRQPVEDVRGRVPEHRAERPGFPAARGWRFCGTVTHCNRKKAVYEYKRCRSRVKQVAKVPSGGHGLLALSLVGAKCTGVFPGRRLTTTHKYGRVPP